MPKIEHNHHPFAKDSIKETLLINLLALRILDEIDIEKVNIIYRRKYPRATDSTILFQWRVVRQQFNQCYGKVSIHNTKKKTWYIERINTP